MFSDRAPPADISWHVILVPSLQRDGSMEALRSCLSHTLLCTGCSPRRRAVGGERCRAETLVNVRFFLIGLCDPVVCGSSTGRVDVVSLHCVYFICFLHAADSYTSSEFFCRELRCLLLFVRMAVSKQDCSFKVFGRQEEETREKKQKQIKG